MRCKHCKTRRRDKAKAQRHTAPSGWATCERCGRPSPPHPDVMLGAEDGTLAHLARFGLAITGDPLLELKREGT